MPETVADVLVRLGVDTSGLRAGFQEARSLAAQLAADLERTFSLGGGVFTFGGDAGGILGNITRTLGNAIPGPFGSVIRGAGGIFTGIVRFFSGLFGGESQTTPGFISQAVQSILGEFRSGAITLGEALRRLEEEREQFLRNFSGQKDGRRVLNLLVPDLDKAIRELQAQQKPIVERFEEALDLLRTGEAFRSVAADVRELIRQYREYVDAGGDLERANEFLSLSLEQLRSEAGRELAEGEERAIRDALQLNALLQEREDLVARFADEEGRIRRRGVLERQRTVAQEKSEELELLRQRRDERLADLDAEIRLLQLKVDSEAQVFDLVRDRVALETRLLELKAEEFEREASRLAGLRQIVAGILPGAGGLLTLSPALQQELHLGSVQIFVGENATPAQAQAAGGQVIEGMLRALAHERARLGLAL